LPFRGMSHTKTDAANELLDLVLSSSPKKKNKIRIESLVDTLTSGSNVYNPEESLYGPLYCTVYSFTPSNPSAPEPLWERISLKDDNIKGQQYYGADNVINYSEIWGPLIHLRAQGTFEPKKKMKNAKNANVLASLFQAPAGKLRSCPDDFTVHITSGSVWVFGKSFQIPISGEGCLRVLYADPRLRLFVSPQNTDGDWEREGLVVVQVRSDLILGETVDLR